MASASGALKNASKKVATPAQEYTKKRGTEWAESKYKPGQRKRNLAVRLGTGHLNPFSYRERAELAGRASKVEAERTGEDAALLNREVSNMTYDEKIEKLQEIVLREGDGRLGQAAARSLVEYGKFEELQKVIDHSGGKGKAAFDKLMKTDSAFGKAVTTARCKRSAQTCTSRNC